MLEDAPEGAMARVGGWVGGGTLVAEPRNLLAEVAFKAAAAVPPLTVDLRDPDVKVPDARFLFLITLVLRDCGRTTPCSL